MKFRLKSVIILIIACLILPLLSFSQGLKIQGNDQNIDDRSSYNVFDNKKPVFTEKLDISFEMEPLRQSSVRSSIGYILRIKNEETNTTYNISFNDQGHDPVFKFNREGVNVLVTARIDRDELNENKWIKISISFDLTKDSLMFGINDKKYYAGNLDLHDKWQPSIYFGRSEHVIDVPSFALRNLEVKDKKQVYTFPLDEVRGDYVHDKKGNIIGYVDNPIWLINDSYYWESLLSLSSKTVAGSNFYPKKQEILYFNKDSITFYNIQTKETYSKRYVNECPVALRLGTNFIDSENNRLYVYEVSDLLWGEVTMAYLDLSDFRWAVVSDKALPTQLHHHGNFFDEVNRRYIIMGGFGNAKFNKNFYSYDIERNKWDTLTLKGDKIDPRYFISMGHTQDNHLYIFGGMGNESGDQTVGRRYYYDLYKVNLDNYEVKKMWEIPWNNENMVPVRGMVITDDSTFYTFCYPEHFSNSLLRLYRFSVNDGSYEILGDSIPICSEKITTNANLYYNANFGELYGIVQEFENDDTASSVNIYSLSFPPIVKSRLDVYSGLDGKYSWLYIMILLPFAVLVIYLLARTLRKKKRRKKEVKGNSGTGNINIQDTLDHYDHKTRPNGVYLFGEFTVCDKQNRDITYMFSTKLKSAFLLIMQYSLTDNGITSQQMSDILWADKAPDKVKNLRGVTLNHLRKILKELNGIELVYEKNVFKIVYTYESYCDCNRLIDIISKNTIDDDVEEFAAILTRGKFLKSFDLPMFDSFKLFVEHRVEPVLISETIRNFENDNFQRVIVLSRAMLNIDPLNEDAIYYLLRSMIKLRLTDDARKCYIRFITDYRNMMGEEYSKAFSEFE